ncbi:hypothetical protein M8C21_003318, partial [Ambrosia artemisiifolia]
MKRELAFALEARSQFGSFTGRTRSSYNNNINNNNNRSVEVIDVNRQNNNNNHKKIKVDVTDDVLVNIDKSEEGKEQSESVVAVEEVLNGEEKSTVAKVYVKRKKGKKEGRCDMTPRRFTRSALKEKEENEEENVGTCSSRKKLEMKMSKKIGLDKMPGNMRELLETGLLEGFRVCYKFGSFGSSSPENLLICDSCLVDKEVDAEPRVATCSEVRTSSLEPKASESNSLSLSSDRKTKRGRKRKSSKSDMKHNKSSGNYIKSRDKIKSKIHKRSLRSASPRPIKSAPKCTSPQLNSGIKLTIKNQQLHWSVFQKGGLPDGTELTYVAQGKKLLDGYKWNNGIFCSCCKTEISASQFEAHAGWATRKKPYENIYISNGVSLHEYAVSMKKNEKGRCSVKYNDDLCRVCWDGGDLLLCDGCPSGKNATTRETRKFLAQTVDIFHEGFNPIIDATSGRDFIPSMVYGRKIWSQDFAGMLCAILTVDSNVVSAGTLRVFGEDIAELPIVATSKCNQGKLTELRQSCSAMMTFKGTSMLHKEIPQAQNDDVDAAGDHGM